jgi:prepilin-type N-terminal cleavage/methylation domain-containing protein
MVRFLLPSPRNLTAVFKGLTCFRVRGFTLAELLVALAILATLATYSIPKVLDAQNNLRYSAITKEFMASIADSYQQALQSGKSFYQIDYSVIFSRLNVVNLHYTAISVKHANGNTYSCGALDCMLLHTGAISWRGGNLCFRPDLGSNQAILFTIDPDAEGPLIAQEIILFANGRVTSSSKIEGAPYFSYGTATNCNFTQTQVAWADQPWFSW